MAVSVKVLVKVVTIITTSKLQHLFLSFLFLHAYNNISILKDKEGI